MNTCILLPLVVTIVLLGWALFSFGRNENFIDLMLATFRLHFALLVSMLAWMIGAICK